MQSDSSEPNSNPKIWRTNLRSFRRTAVCSADSWKSWPKTMCWSLPTITAAGYARFRLWTLLRRWMNWDRISRNSKPLSR